MSKNLAINVRVGSGELEAKSSGELTFIDAPKGFGLANDKLFLEVLLKTTPHDGQFNLASGGETLARFAPAPVRFGPCSLVCLYPLGGVSCSPLTSSSSERPVLLHWLVEELKNTRRWDLARFCSLERGEKDLVRTALRTSGLKWLETPYASYVINEPGDYDSYLRNRTKSFRSSLKAATRKAAGRNLHFKDSVQLEHWRELYQRRSSSLSSSYDYSTSARFQQFLQELRLAYRAEKRICEVGLFHEDRAVAAGLGLIRDKILYFFQTAHDPAFNDCRPGALVFMKMIEQACATGIETIAFLSDAPYLRLFTKQAIPLFELEVFSRQPAAFLLWLYKRFRSSRPTH